MDYYRCENPDCGFVAEQEEPDVCPRCGGTFFVALNEERSEEHTSELQSQR